MEDSRYFVGATYSFTSKGFWPSPLCGRRGAGPRCRRDGPPRPVHRPGGASARTRSDRDLSRTSRPRRQANRMAPPRHPRFVGGEGVGPKRPAESRTQRGRDDGRRRLRGGSGRSEDRERNRGRTARPELESGGVGVRAHLDGLCLRWNGTPNGGHGSPSAERVRGDKTLRGTGGSSSGSRLDCPSALFRLRVEPVVFEDERRDVDPPETRGGPGGAAISRPKSYANICKDRRRSRLRPLGSTHLGALPRELPGLRFPRRNGARGRRCVSDFQSKAPSDSTGKRGAPRETSGRSMLGRPQGRTNVKEAHANIPRLS